MRRKDKEITDRALMESILSEALVCRIGLCDVDIPYVVPVNFGYRDNCLYIHCAKEGRKIHIIKNNNNICFEIDTGHELVKGDTPCSWSFKYYSIIGFGKAYLIEDIEEKRKGLDVIMEKYTGTSSPFEYPEGAIDKVAVIKIRIERMTGKKSGY